MSGSAPRSIGCSTAPIRKEALLTSQIEGTQATLTDLFDKEAGLKIHNADGDVQEVTNYLRAFRWVQAQLHDPQGSPISACGCCARPTVCCSTACAARANNPASCAARKLDWRHPPRQRRLCAPAA